MGIVIEPAQGSNDDSKSTMFREIVCFLSHRLDHPNVVKLLEAYESKHSVYLVMQL